jgi:reactive intermediate/imine deaminase
MVTGGFEAEARRAFENLKAVASAAGASLDQAVRVTIYLTDLANFPVVNGIMSEYFREPYPARVTIGVASLPRGAQVEVDCILVD